MLEDLFRESIRLFNYTHLDDTDLGLVLSWRNDERVKKWLISKQNVSWDEHLKFVSSLRDNDSVFYWLAIVEGDKCGVVSLRIDKFDRSVGTSGIFLNPNLIGYGHGIELAFQATHIFFENYSITKLVNDVFKNNKAAVRLNRLMGYEFHDNPSDPDLYSIVLGIDQYCALPKDFHSFCNRT